MKEVIYRRYFRVLMEGLERPDLIIVDGGKGQIKVAKEVIDGLNMNIMVCGLAKDERHSTSVLLDSNGEVVEINKKSELFSYLLECRMRFTVMQSAFIKMCVQNHCFNRF